LNGATTTYDDGCAVNLKMNTCAFPKDLVLSVERLLLMTMGMPAGLRRQTDGASVKQQNDSVGEDTSNHVLIVLVKSVFFSFLVREFWFFPSWWSWPWCLLVSRLLVLSFRKCPSFNPY
jgi:hypothetical protein